MAELPYRVEYAKSGRSLCKGCQECIHKGDLRVAVRVQSTHFDGKQLNWYHEEGFFKDHRPATVTEISNFNKLTHDDQMRIKETIENYNGVAKKRAAENGSSTSNTALKDFKVEYSENSRDACWRCDDKFCEGEVRICKTTKCKTAFEVYVKLHVQCFNKEREKLLYFAGGDSLPGFTLLTDEDQAMVNEEIKAFKSDDTPVKKLKAERKDEAELKENKNHEKKIEEQNRLFHKYRTALGDLKKKDLIQLLKENDQAELVGRDECLDHLADMMAFGALEPCPKCREGQLVLDTNGYRCTGYISKYTKCCYVTQEPRREPMIIPDSYEDVEPFTRFRAKTDVRLFIAEPQPAMVDDVDMEVVKDETMKPKNVVPASLLPQAGHWIPDSGSTSSSASSNTSVKLKIKGGTAVDPESGLEDQAHVFVDRRGVKFTSVLCRTEVTADQNSYYKLQVLKTDVGNEFYLFRSWGKIGTTIGDKRLKKYASKKEAVVQFENLYFEKTGNNWHCPPEMFEKIPGRYYPIEVDYGDEKDHIALVKVDNSCNLPMPVQELITTIFDINTMWKTLLEFELDTEKMPLGYLSKKQIRDGYTVLTEILQAIENGTADHDEIVDATNRFFSMIPHSFGTENAPLLDNVELVKKKAEMLDNLLEIEIAYSLLKTDDSTCPIESHYNKLNTEITPLDKDSEEFKMVAEYTKNTHAPTHSNYTLEIQEVFKVVRAGEEERYKPFKKLHNRRLLWHGSRVTNFAGILSQGLRVAPPEAPATGDMFGKGIYFADMVSKSANYCKTDKDNPTGLLLLCEVALGNMEECHSGCNKLPVDKHSVWGIGRTEPDPAGNRTLDCGTVVPMGKPYRTKRQTKLLYNEFIVYDVAQVKVKNLLQIKFNH